MLIAVFAIIMYRIIIVALLYASDDDVIKSNAKLATTATAACINLIVILLFNRVSYAMISSMMTSLNDEYVFDRCFQIYERVAVFLTDMGSSKPYFSSYTTLLCMVVVFVFHRRELVVKCNCTFRVLSH